MRAPSKERLEYWLDRVGYGNELHVTPEEFNELLGYYNPPDLWDTDAIAEQARRAAEARARGEHDFFLGVRVIVDFGSVGEDE
jgi:hypothetical protein